MALTDLAVTIMAQLAGTGTKGLTLENGKSTLSSSLSKSTAYTFGAGTNKANCIYTAEIVLNAGATTTLDLFGTLTDIFGMTINAAKVKALIVVNKTLTTADKLEIGGNAGGKALANWIKAVGDIVHLGPGGVFLLSSPVDGYAVTTGTADELEIKNVGGNPVTYDIGFLLEV